MDGNVESTKGEVNLLDGRLVCVALEIAGEDFLTARDVRVRARRVGGAKAERG